MDSPRTGEKRPPISAAEAPAEGEPAKKSKDLPPTIEAVTENKESADDKKIVETPTPDLDKNLPALIQPIVSSSDWITLRHSMLQTPYNEHLKKLDIPSSSTSEPGVTEDDTLADIETSNELPDDDDLEDHSKIEWDEITITVPNSADEAIANEANDRIGGVDPVEAVAPLNVGDVIDITSLDPVDPAAPIAAIDGNPINVIATINVFDIIDVNSDEEANEPF